MKHDFINTVNWVKVDNLVPAIIQDNESGQVLMLGYMNKEALGQTLETKVVTFYSRSKQRLWVKGETSNNFLLLQDISYDCDQDALLILVKPKGPACHKGTITCFEKNFEPSWHIIQHLEKIIAQRKKDMPKDSYVTSLFESGIKRITQKVGEEAVESVIASIANDDDELKSELADMIFHTLVLLRAKNMGLSDVLHILRERKG